MNEGLERRSRLPQPESIEAHKHPHDVRVVFFFREQVPHEVFRRLLQDDRSSVKKRLDQELIDRGCVNPNTGEVLEGVEMEAGHGEDLSEWHVVIADNPTGKLNS